MSFGRIASMKSNALVIVMDFHIALGIMDQGLLSDITIGNTIITLIGREINIAHLLDLGPAVIFDLISFQGQWSKIFPFYGLEKRYSAGLFSLEQEFVVLF